MTDHDIPALDHAALDSLALAHTRTVDALAGFEKMVEKAEPDFLATATRFRDLHRAHAAQLADLLRQYGRAPDDDGSFMSTVNRMVIATRAALDEIDADVMAQVRSGEENLLTAYRDAEFRAPYPKVKSTLAALTTELETLIRETA